jgi:hypothetical protein
MRSLVAAGVVALCGLALTAADNPEISPDNLRAHLQYLASDDMKGRANGSPELDRAGEYIARQFAAAGLEPGGVDGWFQPFELVAGLTIAEGNQLTIKAGRVSVAFTLGTSYYPLAAQADGPLTRLDGLDLVFAGYGIVAPDARYDDYAGLDVRGKAVLVFSHEPQEQNPNSRLHGTKPLPQTTLFAKAGAASDRGAKLLIVVGDPTHFSDQADYALFARDPEVENTGIPVLRVRRKEAQPLVDALQLDARARRIDDDLVPRSGPVPAVVTYAEHLVKNRRTVRNVVGVLRGSDDTRRGEAVVIGAHYDHVGLGGHLSVTPEKAGEIHNGADDNASGTSAIMEIARVAAGNRRRFPRSLVFVAFAGEERGLLGSMHYTSVPPIPIADTVAMLNLDMVGRAKGSVDVSGLEASPSMEDDLKAAAAATVDLTIRREGPGAGRSDDASFLDRRVPAINFFTGFHGDYHRPTDDWDRVDVPGTTRVATLAMELAARLAARGNRPEFVQR